MPLAGVIHVHDISSQRVHGSTKMSLKMFAKLARPPPIALVTTKWHGIKKEAGDRREQELQGLQGLVWKDAIARGATIHRTDNPDAYVHIVDTILSLSRPEAAAEQVKTPALGSDVVQKESTAPLTFYEELLEFDVDFVKGSEGKKRRRLFG